MSGGNKNKKRGYVLEKEVVDLADELGFDAKRAWGSNGNALGKERDVDVSLSSGGSTLDFQVKRKKKLPLIWKLPKHLNGVIFREDNDKTSYVLVDLEKYLIMAKSYFSSK